jgi:hypothetical protein
MAKKPKKEQVNPGTSLQEMDIASPGGNLNLILILFITSVFFLLNRKGS